MGILRVPEFLIFAVFLAGCAAHTPVLETQDDVSTVSTQPDSTATATAKVKSEAKKSKLAAPNGGTTIEYDSSVPPNVGSAKMGKRTRGGWRKGNI
jgi:hypothetical protein